MPGSRPTMGTKTGLGPGDLAALAVGELKSERIGTFTPVKLAKNDEVRRSFMEELGMLEGRLDRRFDAQDKRVENLEGRTHKLELWQAEVKGPIDTIVRRMQRYVNPLTIVMQAISAAILLVTCVGLIYQLLTGQPLISMTGGPNGPTP